MFKKISIAIWVILVFYTFVFTSNYYMESKKNTKVYDEIKASYKETYIEESSSSNEIMTRYSNILDINDEVVGWISIPGTNIDYPVVKGNDNTFYLDKNINKQHSLAGSIFMDFRNNGMLNDPNTVIYGHNMKDNSMFGELKKYKQQDFVENNKIIEMNSLNKEMRWEIFAVYVAHVDFNYIQTDFSSAEEFERFINKIQKKSAYKNQVEVLAEDNILTLSTCSYEFDDARLVIHAKKIE